MVVYLNIEDDVGSSSPAFHVCPKNVVKATPVRLTITDTIFIQFTDSLFSNFPIQRVNADDVDSNNIALVTLVLASAALFKYCKLINKTDEHIKLLCCENHHALMVNVLECM